MRNTINNQLQRFLFLFFGETEIKPLFFYTVASIFILFGLIMQSPGTLISGYWTILLSPSNLITDYFEVGGFGAIFFTFGTLTLAIIFLIIRTPLKLIVPL